MKFTLPQLQRISYKKQIYIWGAMIVGQGVCRALERHKISVAGFLDSSPNFKGKKALGYPIFPPEEKLGKNSDNTLILISSGHYDLEIEEYCIKAGLTRNRNYILSRDLNDIDPSIDISGLCNLKCISCPRGNIQDHSPAGQMSITDYQAVLKKLLKELPFLGSIQLYTWGEPLLNKHLPEMIAITRKSKVLTAISSNLNIAGNYEKLIASKPDWIKVSASGFGKSYEKTHTGGKWEKFLSNLMGLAELRDKLHPELQIVLNYHLYKHNLGEDYSKMKELCRDINLIFRPNAAYLYPMENIRDYLLGKSLSPQAIETIKMLLMPLEEGIAQAKRLKNNPCPEERCLPINWDRKVRFCGVYYRPFIADDFLTTPLKDILHKRVRSNFCKECKSFGLHQFTGVYLQEKIVT